ncbi:Ankyrin repeat-containing domain protein [Madurella fahalii]|uniref:Ankyrin repeat-containing domain protein n=1 Tax=Madurella fahalii TaxID=1157608 RepID=A0ABQ0GL51_9PEZI
MASHSIAALPIELLVFVIENLDNTRDIAALTRTNRRVYGTANPLLYRHAAHRGDARPLAWAAARGLVGTLKMALAAGIDPNHEFIDSLSRPEWEKANAAARAAAAAAAANPGEDSYDSVWDVKWSLETDDADHAATPTTAQSMTVSTSDVSRHPLSSSDAESVSDPLVSQPSEVSSAVEPVSGKPDLVVRRYRAIHLAARAGHDDIVGILADHGVPLDIASQHLCDCIPLYGLLNATEQPQDIGPMKWSALHLALCHSRSETAKLLLSRGASYQMVPSTLSTSSLEREYGHGLTALHYAAGMGLTDVVRYLVDNKIQTELDVQDEWTITPFYYAYANRCWDSTVPLLLELGANVECDIKMYIPYTAITPLGEACRLGDYEEADRLIDLGGDVKRGFIALTKKGCLTPLHMCCMRSAQPVPGARPRKMKIMNEEETAQARMKTIAKLLAHGADINARDCFGSTPLMAAVQANNIPAIEALVKAGVDLQGYDAASRAALMKEIRATCKPAITEALSLDQSP